MREALRRHRFAFALIATLVAVLFLGPVIRREVFVVRDHTDYFQPLRFFTTVHLRGLALPHWNPYSASGEPWLANPQTGVFYPPAWLFLFLPFHTAYMLFLAAHLAILGCGAYLLFARSVSKEAALVGGVAIAFSGPVLSLLDVSNNLTTFAWVPWVLWSVHRPVRAALFLALAFLGGEPFFAALAAFLYVAVRVIPSGSEESGGRGGAWKDILLTAVAAFGLSAMQLLPFLEMVRGSDRAAGLSAAEMFRESMAPADWLRVAIPPRLSGGGFDHALSQHFIPVIYVGLAVAVLAVLAWVFVRRREVIGWTALLVVAIVIAAGSHLPLGSLLEHLPVTPFRYPSRVVPFGALALVALATLAWDRFRPRRRWADLVIVLVLLVDLVPRAAPLLRTEPYAGPPAVYPSFAGRPAKMIRIHNRPIVDRPAWIAGYRNLYHGRFDASTAAPLIERRYDRFQTAMMQDRRFDLFQFAAVGFILSDHWIAPPFQPLATVRGVTMFANRGAPPMAALWTSWRAMPDDEAALEALIVEGTDAGLPVAGAPPSPTEAAGPRLSPVEKLSVDTKRAAVVVDAPAAGIVVITQQDARSWRVYVDGVEERKLLAGGIFRAVHVPAGRHEVVWRWNPSMLRIGIAMTIITALSLYASAFVKRFRRRKFSS
ncbi:MAG TPA: YfhO family protein [Thermoanaerobaculia bacterium]|nr:YfhO family protein [Thermoanaerobaculia bacterium]